MKIKSSEIGKNAPVFIIAELSGNHGGQFEIALRSIQAIAKTGADAVKLQTYTADTLTIDSSKSYFKITGNTPWDGKTLYELYKEAYTPWDWQPKLKTAAEDLGLVCFSTPFDHSAVDFLEEMNVPAYKIASFEIFDIPLIEYIASKEKPVIISTGIATYDDIQEAVDACSRKGNDEVALLKCTSAYPTPYEETNLMSIPDMAKEFQMIIGLSDHTLGIEVPVAAVALGAKIVEKHFILDKGIGGPDAGFSLEPNEFKAMVQSVRNVEIALGQPVKEPSETAKKNAIFARSLFAVKDIKSGELLSKENVRSIRPGNGLHPKNWEKVLTMKAVVDISEGTPLSWDILE